MSDFDESSIDSDFSKDSLVDSCDSCSIESNNNLKNNNTKQSTDHKSTNLNFDKESNIFNEDIQEILVVLLLGILIIFILDLFMRIGKTN